MTKRVDIIASIGAQDRTGNAFRQVDQKLKGMQASSDRTGKVVNGNFQLMRGGAAQFGYQIQDIAVQLQGGQNALLIFGQQGSQIASLFGTGGAFAGALLAVSAALGTAFLPKLLGTEKALADVDAELSRVRETMKLTADGSGVLTSSFEELSEVSKDLAKNAILQSYNSALIATAQSQVDLTKATEDFSKAYAIFTTATPIKDLQKQYDIARDKAMALYDASKEIRMGDVAVGAAQMKDILVELIDPASGANTEFRVMAGEVLGLLDKYDKATASADQLQQILQDLAAGNALNTETSVNARKAIEEQITAMQREATVMNMTARAKVIYEAVQNGATASDLEVIARTYDKISAYEREQEALKELSEWHTAVSHRAEEYAAKQLEAYKKAQEGAVKLLEQEQASLLTGVDAINHAYDERVASVREALTKIGAEQARFAELEAGIEAARAAEITKYHEDAFKKEMLLYQARFQAAGQLAGAMAGVFREGSKEQRAFLALQKGLAVGEAVMNMHRAISNANAVPFPGNILAIANATTTGLGAIAGIRSVSFDGGGYTGNGARVGGLDGKGGFAAIMHPNETVIDHTKGGQLGTNVNFTIVANDTNGFAKLLQQNRGQIIHMIREATNNQGRRSNV